MALLSLQKRYLVRVCVLAVRFKVLQSLLMSAAERLRKQPSRQRYLSSVRFKILRLIFLCPQLARFKSSLTRCMCVSGTLPKQLAHKPCSLLEGLDSAMKRAMSTAGSFQNIRATSLCPRRPGYL